MRFSNLLVPSTNLSLKKYENTATPSSGYASRCQMALNHFDHNKRMMRSPRSGIETFPTSWCISSLPAWTHDMTALCDKYVEEINEASKSVKECRKMASAQDRKHRVRILMSDRSSTNDH